VETYDLIQLDKKKFLITLAFWAKKNLLKKKIPEQKLASSTNCSYLSLIKIFKIITYVLYNL
jgi:hypothetical protein